MPARERGAPRPRRPATTPLHPKALARRALADLSRGCCSRRSGWQPRRFGGLLTNQPALPGIGHDADGSRERRIGCAATADVHDGGVLKIAGENIQRACTRISVDRVEQLIEHHPPRSVDEQTREHELLL